MLSHVSGDFLRNILVGLGLIVVFVVIGAVVMPWIRKRYHPTARREDGTLAGGFSMEDLSRMRRSGEVSEDEFRRLRRRALGLDEAEPKTDISASSHPIGGDDDESASTADGDRADADGEAEKEQR